MAQIEHTKPAAKSTKRPSRKPLALIVPPEPPMTDNPPMTKRERLRARLEQIGGASLTQLETEFGWLPHTVRAAISGLRKAGLEVQRETLDTSSVYRIVTSKVA